MSQKQSTGAPAKPKQLALIDRGPAVKPKRKSRGPDGALWTRHKALLIERYLYYFVLVTRHGTYIDGFAGPQQEEQGAECWSARRVIESRPRWFRSFYLFEQDPQQVERIREMYAKQPPRDRKRAEPSRSVMIREGDCNIEIPAMLARCEIRDKEATFALLDQRTLECHWSTVEALAKYKSPGFNKIEIFYFLAEGWLDRTIANNREDKVARWWGRSDWQVMRAVKGLDRATIVAERFRKELGYASAEPLAFKQPKSHGGRVMMYMIHATDHPAAPTLMMRAYKNVLKPVESPEQLALEMPNLFTNVGDPPAEDSEPPPP